MGGGCVGFEMREAKQLSSEQRVRGWRGSIRVYDVGGCELCSFYNVISGGGGSCSQTDHHCRSRDLPHSQEIGVLAAQRRWRRRRGEDEASSLKGKMLCWDGQGPIFARIS